MTQHEQAMEACHLLVDAYKEGLRNSGEIDWSDVDNAHAMARKAVRKRTARKTKDPSSLWDNPNDSANNHKLADLAPRMAVLLEWFSRSTSITVAGMVFYGCGEQRIAEAKEIIAELKGTE